MNEGAIVRKTLFVVQISYNEMLVEDVSQGEPGQGYYIIRAVNDGQDAMFNVKRLVEK